MLVKLYTKSRQPISGLTHLFGALLSVIALYLLIQSALINGSKWHLISFTVYGISQILVFLSSTLYHLLPLSKDGIQRLRKIDHMMIFVFIAGTYTPYCLIPLRGPWGWTLLTIIWTLALTGFIVKIFWVNAPRWINVSIYLLTGWISISAIYPLYLKVPSACLMGMMSGAFFYSFGAIIYGFKWPNPIPEVFGFHEIWHLFVLAGSFSFFWSIWRYLPYLN